MENNSIINQLHNIVIDVIKQWQIILLVTVLCAVSYDVYSTYTYQPYYRCEATFSIKSTTSSSSADSNENVGKTFSYIFSSNIFKKTIEDALGVDRLDGNYKVAVVDGTNILDISASSKSIKTSYDMMKALMENYQEISHLVVGNTNIEILNDITVPTKPYNMVNHTKNLVLAGGLGFVFIVGILGFYSFIKETVKSEEDIEKKLNLRLLGSLPSESKLLSFVNLKKKKSILISQFTTSFAYVETFKTIRNKIENYCKKNNAKVIMVTSSIENEGKSSIAVNTALSLALNKNKVLIIDGDLRKPSVNLILDEKDKYKGIGDILNNECKIEDAIRRLPQYSVDVLLGYEYLDNSSDLIVSSKMEEILNYARNHYDYVVIDTAPSRHLSDTRLLASLVDGIILVVRQNNAYISSINETIEKLSLSKTPILGCINNRSISMTLKHNKYYGYKYGYHYGYGRRGRSYE